MELPLARRYVGDDNRPISNADRLNQLLEIIEKRKKKKNSAQPSTKNEEPDVDSGIECSASVVEPQIDNYVTIGGHSFANTSKVIASLPKWLSQPRIVSTDLKERTVKTKKFSILDDVLLRNLKSHGIKYLFPVQYEVIPWLLRQNCRQVWAPRDLCVSAPTGSGKTLTYVLPILHSLKNRLVPKIRALIVVPVQELALQVVDVFRKYGKGTDLKIEVTTGGKTELSAEQLKLIRRISGFDEIYESKVDILVTTPGRLVEHINSTNGFDLSHLKYLVVDEADRIMNNVQDDWMHVLNRQFLNSTNRPVCVRSSIKRRQPQKLLFSATLSHDPEKLKQLGLFQPILFTSTSNKKRIVQESGENYVGKYSTPEELKEYYVAAPVKEKPLILCHLVEKGWKKILCFAKSVEDAHKLARLLGLLLPSFIVEELSSKLSRSRRETTLSNFAEGRIDVLVCSDVMARGVDVPGVEYVVSYDPPKTVEGYVHRVGRTGRAGSSGTAVTFLDPQQQLDVFMEKLSRVHKTNVEEMSVEREDYLSRLSDYKKALSDLKNVVESELNEQKDDLKRRKNNNRNKPKAKKVKSK